jgi:prepilin signal peptidase PulO-like enzyme (type II secretory pathway)
MPMTGSADIAQWRLRVFTTLMSMVRWLALLAAVPSAALAIHRGVPVIALMDTLALAWILAIWRLDRISYQARVLNFLAMLYGVAIGTMVTVDTLGLCFLMAAPVMAVILLGMRSGVAMLALCAASMMALGLLGYSHFPMGGFAANSFATVAIFT